MEDILSAGHPVQLRQIDPSRRRARAYHLSASTSLFGELGLVITWGRVGRQPRVRFETIGSEAELEARWRELIAKRLAHGYELTNERKRGRRAA